MAVLQFAHYIPVGMAELAGVFRLRLVGPFRLEGPGGARVEVTSKRAQALLAMLAVSDNGERSRAWLQDRLWGSRAPEQASASLRRELSNLRQLINLDGYDLLLSAHGRLWLDLSILQIDRGDGASGEDGELLEGIDIIGEELFEDWLRQERAKMQRRFDPLPTKATPQVPRLAQDPKMFGHHSALAVLPFKSDVGNEQRALGLCENLIDRISRLRWLPVIASSSSFASASIQSDPCRIGAELGAAYVVEGSLQGNHLNVWLINAQSGARLWQGQSVLDFSEQAGVLDTALNGITATLGIAIDRSEQSRALAKAKSDLNVRDLIWRGRWHLSRLTKEDALIARQCFDEAMTREPNSPEAIIQATWVRMWDLWVTRAREEDIRAVRKMAQNAIIADYEDARGHMLAGIGEIWLRQPLRAEALLLRAIELNPSLVMAHAQLGSAQHLRGDHHGAIASLRTAIRLSPNDQDLFYMQGELAMALVFVDAFEEALVHAEHSIARRQGYWVAHVAKIVALSKLEQIAQAKLARDELQTAIPNFNTDNIKWLPFIDDAKRQFLQNALNLVTNNSD